MRDRGFGEGWLLREWEGMGKALGFEKGGGWVGKHLFVRSK